jgi:hypothetical protein
MKILVVLAVVFFFVSSAIAQESWLLWKKIETDVKHVEWEMTEAYPSYEQCMARKSYAPYQWYEVLSKLKQMGEQSGLVGPGKDLEVIKLLPLSDGGLVAALIRRKDVLSVHFYSFHCYPSSFDPRK